MGESWIWSHETTSTILPVHQTNFSQAADTARSLPPSRCSLPFLVVSRPDSTHLCPRLAKRLITSPQN